MLHEHTPEGDYLQACTEVLGGRAFLALVPRLGDHDGWTGAPVRVAAHRRRRLARAHVPA
ncbi:MULTISPECIES: hypothetical protein [unclassified Amycolatopsis]|uniref:hypothetical protein n=1 Tax=unclassified Amycolatopsis TaxID=2618356 RepID=UPI00196AE392|nr:MULTISPECIES: hypothetical protein [unclassified Amycolatopsis]